MIDVSQIYKLYHHMIREIINPIIKFFVPNSQCILLSFISLLFKLTGYVIHIPDKDVPLLSNFLFQTPNLYSAKKEMTCSLS